MHIFSDGEAGMVSGRDLQGVSAMLPFICGAAPRSRHREVRLKPKQGLGGN